MKNIVKISIIISLLLLSGLLSCSKDKNPLSPTTGFTIEQFPKEIGTIWQYQRITNGISGTVTDTQFVLIDGITEINNDSLEVLVVIEDQVTNWNINPDTTYWHIVADTVTFYKIYSDSLILIQKLVFPLEVGNDWQTEGTPGYSNFVVSKSSKSVLGKNYQNAVNILSLENNQAEFSEFDYWYVQNVGLIQSNSSRVGPYDLPADFLGSWELISFYEPDSLKLSDFPMQVGASWNYKVYNNLVDCPNCFDTSIVTILDSIMDRGGNMNEHWIFDYPNQGNIFNNSINNSLNNVTLQWHHYPVFFSLDFPLIVGKKWFNNFFLSSTTQVLGRQTITTEAGTFKDAYFLKGENLGFEESATFYIWIAKGYGIVKLLHSSSDMWSYQDKSWELTSYDPQNPIEPFSIDKFPNHDGMSRTYETYRSMDGMSGSYDTILVQVAETSTVALWNYTNSSSIRQEIVSIEGTVAKFFYPDNIVEPFKSYQFPLEIGNFWTTYPLNNSSHVTSISPILVPAGRFFPCYAIKTDYTNNSEGITYEIEWIAPEFGLVQKTVVYAFPRTTETWRLIDYTD